MHANRIRIIVLAATLAAVPLSAQSASARPDPGPPPSTVQERPDGFDPGWDTYSYGGPAYGRNGPLPGDLRRLEVASDLSAYRPGGSVYDSQVPQQAQPTTSPTDEGEATPGTNPCDGPGGSLYRSQVPRAAWEC